MKGGAELFLRCWWLQLWRIEWRICVSSIDSVRSYFYLDKSDIECRKMESSTLPAEIGLERLTIARFASVVCHLEAPVSAGFDWITNDDVKHSHTSARPAAAAADRTG